MFRSFISPMRCKAATRHTKSRLSFPPFRSPGQQQRFLSPEASAELQKVIAAENVHANVFLRPALFTGTVCFGSFGAAAIWKCQEKATTSYFAQLQAAESLRPTPAIRELLPDQLISLWESIIRDPRFPTIGPIIAANVAFHCLFLLPGMSVFKIRHFLHFTGSDRGFPLISSVFAHGGALHLGCNMFSLWSIGAFGEKACGGRENFWAAYLRAGTLSSFTCICGDMAMLRFRGYPMTLCWGASGAIYGVISAVCLTYPNSQFILPWISGQDVLKGLVLVDLAGVALGLRALGHVAHLGGVAAGYVAVNMDGFKLIGAYQHFIARNYMQLRKYLFGVS